MYDLQLKGRIRRGLIRGGNLAKNIQGKDFAGVKEEGEVDQGCNFAEQNYGE